jgi:uncharacterized protein YdhG (YjbR/CyaY superfamily)
VAKAGFKSVDEYIAAQPEAVRPILVRVRRAIRKAVPKAEEVISYKMPAYTIGGRAVLYFAGWKQHYSLYPVTERLVAACSGTPAAFEVKKGTIRFPLTEPVPVKFVEQIAKLRAKERLKD